MVDAAVLAAAAELVGVVAVMIVAVMAVADAAALMQVESLQNFGEEDCHLHL